MRCEAIVKGSSKHTATRSSLEIVMIVLVSWFSKCKGRKKKENSLKLSSQKIINSLQTR